MTKAEPLFEFADAYPSDLWTDRGRTIIGVSGRMGTKNHAVWVLDGHEVRHQWPMAHRVSKVVIGGRRVFVGTSGGRLFGLANRGDSPPSEIVTYTNSPFFSTHGDVIVVGSMFEGVYFDGNEIDGLAGQTLRTAVLDDENLYAAYDDERVRIYSRKTLRKKRKTWSYGYQAATGNGRIYVGNRASEFTIVDPASGEPVGHFSHPKRVRTWTEVRVFGDRVLTWSADAVQVQDPDGELLMRWESSEGERAWAMSRHEIEILVALGRSQRQGRVVVLTQ